MHTYTQKYIYFNNVTFKYVTMLLIYFDNILLKIIDLKNIIDCLLKVSYKLFNY